MSFHCGHRFWHHKRPEWAALPLIAASGVMLVMQIPTGIWADRHSRRRAVILGSLVSAAALPLTLDITRVLLDALWYVATLGTLAGTLVLFLVLPTLAALEQGIHVIAVRENRNMMHNDLTALPWAAGQLCIVDNYLEAAGVMAALKAGVDPATVRRPLPDTVHVKRGNRVGRD